MKILCTIISIFTLSITMMGNCNAATAINFDNVPAGTIIDNQYSAQGVTFSTFQGTNRSNDGHVYAQTDTYAKSKPNSIRLSNNALPYINEYDGYINVHFSQLQNWVSVDVAAIVVAEFATYATLPPYIAAYGAKDPKTGKNPLLQTVYYPTASMTGLGTTKPGPWQTLAIYRPTNDIQFVVLSSLKASPPAYGEFDNLTFAATAEPYISNNPTGIKRPQGMTAILTVGALGPGPLQYQWYKNGSIVQDGHYMVKEGTPTAPRLGSHDISGSTTAQLKIVNLRAADSGSYYVIVKNQAGSVTSKAAQLTVMLPVPSPIVPIRQQAPIVRP